MVTNTYTTAIAQDTHVVKTWSILFVLLVYALSGSVGI
jgi:hypothetical protein